MGGSEKFSKGMKLLQDLSSLAELSNYLIKLVDPDIHERMVLLRETMIKRSAHSMAICTVDPSLHTSLGIIVNRRSGTHRDSTDAKDSWAVMFPLGIFSGGDIEFPKLGLTSRYRSGDVVLLRAREVEHAVKEWSGLVRVTLVYFSKESVWKEYS